ncbi:MAG: c-type cytochrome [Vulcanimicrobiaceae bacterium]
MLKGIIVGAIATVAVTVVAGYAGITSGLLVPANADAQPGKFERWAASKSLHATIRREAPKMQNPVAENDENLLAGIKLYGENCAVCHGTAKGDDDNASKIAKGLYQKPPQLAKDGVEDDPAGVTYWKVKHGIRMTGMPAFTQTLSDTQIWQVSLFLKHMDHLTPAPERAWEALKVQ